MDNSQTRTLTVNGRQRQEFGGLGFDGRPEGITLAIGDRVMSNAGYTYTVTGFSNSDYVQVVAEYGAVYWIHWQCLYLPPAAPYSVTLSGFSGWPVGTSDQPVS